jgi:hypothetical protein
LKGGYGLFGCVDIPQTNGVELKNRCKEGGKEKKANHGFCEGRATEMGFGRSFHAKFTISTIKSSI